MFHDFIQYAQLRIRLFYRALSRTLAGFLFSDLREDRDAGSRLYQAYVLVFLAITLVLLWFSLLSLTRIAFLALGQPLAQLLLNCLPLLPAGFFLLASLAKTLSSPWKLSQPDTAYVAASPLATVSIILWHVLVQVLLLGVMGALLGYLLGTGFSSILGEAVAVGAMTALATLLATGIVIWSWLLGAVRLALPQRRKWWYLCGVFTGLFLLLLIVVLLVNGQLPLGPSLPQPATYGALCTICLLGLILLSKAATRIDVIRVINENTVYAETQSLRLAPLYLLEGSGEIRRQKRVQHRGPWIAIPIGSGSAAFLSRSALSHLRQFESLPHILFWGATAAPLAAILVFSPGFFPTFWLLWGLLLLLLPSGVREITRTYRDDCSNTLMKNQLPFNNLKLLALHALPGLVLAVIASLTCVLLVFGTTTSLLFATLFCLIANGVFVLCSGVDTLPFFNTARKLSYEMAVLVFIAALLFFTLLKLPLLALGFTLAYAAALAFLIWRS